MRCKNCGRNLEEIQATSGGVTYEHKKESRNLFIYCSRPEPEITIQRDTQNVEDVPKELIKNSKTIFIGKMEKAMKLYEVKLWVYADGRMNPESLIGLWKGLAKVGGKILVDIPDDKQQGHPLRLRFYAPETSVLDWKKQIESYGVKIEEISA